MKKITTLLILSFCAILNAQNIYNAEISSAICPIEDFGKIQAYSQDDLANYLKEKNGKDNASALKLSVQSCNSVSFKVGQEMYVPESTSKKLVGDPIELKGSIYVIENVDFLDCHLSFKKSVLKGIVELGKDSFIISDTVNFSKLIPKLRAGEIRIINAKITDDSLYEKQKLVEFWTIKLSKQGLAGDFQFKPLKATKAD